VTINVLPGTFTNVLDVVVKKPLAIDLTTLLIGTPQFVVTKSKAEACEQNTSDAQNATLVMAPRLKEVRLLAHAPPLEPAANVCGANQFSSMASPICIALSLVATNQRFVKADEPPKGR